jgi:dipeptidase
MFRLVLAACLLASASACSNLLVAPGASDNGDTLIAYASDDAALFGQLYHWPAAMHLANETVECFDWDSGAYLGEIPQAPETYNVVGNTNEHQLTIAETTFGGMQCSVCSAV